MGGRVLTFLHKHFGIFNKKFWTFLFSLIGVLTELSTLLLGKFSDQQNTPI